MFGFFATFYVILLMLEIWSAYRPYIVEQAQKRSDLLGRVYKLLTLGSYDVSDGPNSCKARCPGRRSSTSDAWSGPRFLR
jgi:hypothetical protein